MIHPHINIRDLPNIYLRFGLASLSERAVGVTISGLLGLMIDRNKNIVFGLTFSFIENQDIYIEKVNIENENEYWNDGKWIPFKIKRRSYTSKKGSGSDLSREVNSEGGRTWNYD